MWCDVIFLVLVARTLQPSGLRWKFDSLIVCLVLKRSTSMSLLSKYQPTVDKSCLNCEKVKIVHTSLRQPNANFIDNTTNFSRKCYFILFLFYCSRIHSIPFDCIWKSKDKQFIIWLILMNNLSSLWTIQTIKNVKISHSQSDMHIIWKFCAQLNTLVRSLARSWFNTYFTFVLSSY